MIATTRMPPAAPRAAVDSRNRVGDVRRGAGVVLTALAGGVDMLTPIEGKVSLTLSDDRRAYTPRSFRTLATCPVAFTLCSACTITPASSITKVDRMTPTTALP